MLRQTWCESLMVFSHFTSRVDDDETALYASTLEKRPTSWPTPAATRMPHYRMRGSAGAIGPAPLTEKDVT